MVGNTRLIVTIIISSDAFDRCWCGDRDQLVISAFFASILALIYAIAALIFVVYRVKHEKQSSGKREELP